MDCSPNARDMPPRPLAGAEGAYAPSCPAFTNADPPFFLSAPSPSKASTNSAYARAACSSSSLRFASAASFSFSFLDFRRVPWVNTARFWSSISFC